MKSDGIFARVPRGKFENVSGGLGLWLSGRALAWHVRGPGFNPQHHIKIKVLCPPATKKYI